MNTTKKFTGSPDDQSRTTRRQIIASAAIACVGLASISATTDAATGDVSHTAESIHQEVVFKASRKRIYEALIDTKQFDRVIQLSGAMQSMSLGNSPTQIAREPGGTFTVFGGHIVGRQIELVSNERIVQAWRVVDWQPGLYSMARFALLEQGQDTKLTFDHTGFPDGQGDHLAVGWKMNYWTPLAKFLA
jgi:activator of HSP90 ATPase